MKEKNSMVSETSSDIYLQKLKFSELPNWSVRYLLENSFSYNDQYELVAIGDFLKRNKETIEIQDGIEYRRVTIKINNNGVHLRDTEKGENIGTKRQYVVRKGQFIMSKIDARNGAFGLIPDELDGAIVTNDFPSFHVDDNRINTQFLVLITTTKEFINFAQSCSSGTTNRQRINIDLFLQQRVPLPSLMDQERIVTAYNEKIVLADRNDDEAKLLYENIEEYLFEQLGLRKSTTKSFKVGVLNFFRFSNTKNRWDIQNDASAIFDALSISKYPVFELGDYFEFVNRKWNKVKHIGETFNYIELGSVDPLLGITDTSTLLVKNAPSRATQTVKSDELIIGTTRPYLKRFTIVSDINNGNVASSGFQIIGSKQDYNLRFLLYYLKSDYGVKQFEYFMTGALYPAITSKDLKRILIPIPPLEIQNEIASSIDELEAEIITKRNCSMVLRKKALKQFENEIFQID